MICSMFFIKFFGLFLIIGFVAGAVILLYYISGLEEELGKEKGKETSSLGGE